LISAIKFAISVLALAAACLAQEGLTVDNKHKERVSTPEAEKIYFSACSVVREEFDVKRPILPRVKLVLGASKNGVSWNEREIWLTRWDRYLFAQGVAMLAFADLLTGDRKVAMTKRAVNWSDATVEIERLAKYRAGPRSVVWHASSVLLTQARRCSSLGEK